MIIVIDAYNVLKSQSHQSVSQATREAYIHRICAYCDKRGHTAWIIFDGGPYLYPVTHTFHQVTVMYSGERETADTCIQRLLLSQPVDNTIVVSSDRELVDYADAYGFVSIDPSVFTYYVDRALTPDKAGMQRHASRAQKRSGHESSAYVDRLMQEGSQCIMHKEDDITHDISEHTEHPGARTLSRHEKLLWHILRKL